MDCDLLVKNGRVVVISDATDVAVKDRQWLRCLCPMVRDGVRAGSGPRCEGQLVLPGTSSVHAHLSDPGFTWREDFAHGTARRRREQRDHGSGYAPRTSRL